MIAHIFRLSVWEWHKAPPPLVAVGALGNCRNPDAGGSMGRLRGASQRTFLAYTRHPIERYRRRKQGSSLRSGMEVQGRARRPHSAGGRRAR